MKEPTSFTVFLSSTFVDLSEHRKKVIEGLRRLETGVDAMEYFCASTDSSRTLCLRKVQSAGLYVGIIGLRYGSIDFATGLSYTEEEYNEATKNNIPTLLFLIDESKETSIRPADIDYENIDKLRQFKDRVKRNHAVDFFASPEDLAMKVATAIMKHINDNKTLAEKHRINSEIQEAIKPTSELTAHQLLHRFKIFPKRWAGIRFNATLENTGFGGWVQEPYRLDVSATNDCDQETIRVPWRLPNEEASPFLIFAEGETAYRLIDIETPANIVCSIETTLIPENHFSTDDDIPHLGLKIVDVLDVSPQSIEQQQAEAELPF